MFDFTNQVVVIGGATGNLGTAVAQAFHKAGARLVLVDRGSLDRLEKMYPEWAGSADVFFAHSVDLTDAEAVNGMVQETINRFGRIDVLANTAGGFRSAPVHETTLESWDFILNLNARSVFIISKAVIPQMIAQGSGKIIHVSARAALNGAAGMGVYSASKSMVVRLTEGMSADLKDQGINVNCLLPGTIDTLQNRQGSPNADYSRWVTPEAIADVMLFLASDAGRAIHGAAIPVYGRS